MDTRTLAAGSREPPSLKTIWQSGCRSWYLDDRGVPDVWPWTFDRFREKMAKPQLADFETA